MSRNKNTIPTVYTGAKHTLFCWQIERYIMLKDLNDKRGSEVWYLFKILRTYLTLKQQQKAKPLFKRCGSFKPIRHWWNLFLHRTFSVQLLYMFYFDLVMISHFLWYLKVRCRVDHVSIWHRCNLMLFMTLTNLYSLQEYTKLYRLCRR